MAHTARKLHTRGTELDMVGRERAFTLTVTFMVVMHSLTKKLTQASMTQTI